MPPITEATVSQRSGLVGLPTAPVIDDLRIDDDYRSDMRLLPGSLHREAQSKRCERGAAGEPK